MKFQSKNTLLYIEPENESTKLTIDEITMKMFNAIMNHTKVGILLNGKLIENDNWRGFHFCVCDEMSSCNDYLLPSGHITNSLCVHYVAFHRDEVPKEDLIKIKKFIDIGNFTQKDVKDNLNGVTKKFGMQKWETKTGAVGSTEEEEYDERKNRGVENCDCNFF